MKTKPRLLYGKFLISFMLTWQTMRFHFCRTSLLIKQDHENSIAQLRNENILHNNDNFFKFHEKGKTTKIVFCVWEKFCWNLNIEKKLISNLRQWSSTLFWLDSNNQNIDHTLRPVVTWSWTKIFFHRNHSLIKWKNFARYLTISLLAIIASIKIFLNRLKSEICISSFFLYALFNTSCHALSQMHFASSLSDNIQSQIRILSNETQKLI